MPLLKRQFDKKGNLSHLDVLEETPVGEEWHPSPRVIDRGLAEGWLSIGGGEVRIKTAPDVDDHVFKILAAPGVFCCHCGAKLDAGNEVAQAHVADEHSGADSPDESNPAGYRYDNFTRLERVS
jgi:hypothetical protein